MGKLTKIASGLEALAARDYRFSELKQHISKALPLLATTRDNADRRALTSRERRSLTTLVAWGNQLRKIQPDLQRIDRDLGRAVDELGRILRGES